LAPLLARIGSDGDEGRAASIETILAFRSPVVARILAAEPVDCLRVVIDIGDQGRLFVMSQFDQAELALAVRSGQLLAADGPDGEHVRLLARAPENIESPLLAVARADLTPEGWLTWAPRTTRRGSSRRLPRRA
jgi:hypothetical protein